MKTILLASLLAATAATAAPLDAVMVNTNGVQVAPAMLTLTNVVIQGFAFEDLADVDISDRSVGDVPTWDGTNLVFTAPGGHDPVTLGTAPGSITGQVYNLTVEQLTDFLEDATLQLAAVLGPADEPSEIAAQAGQPIMLNPDADSGDGTVEVNGNLSVSGVITGTGTNLTGIVKLPSGHTSGVTNLVGIAGDGVTPVFVPTSSTWQGFIAYRGTSNFVLPASSTTQVIYNTEVRDTLGLHDTTTGYFRPNKTGLWRITASGVTLPTAGNPNTAGAYYDLKLRKVSDSSITCNLGASRTISASVGATLINPGSAIVYLTSGVDYAIAVQIGDTKEWSLYASESFSRFSAEFVSE